MKADDGGVAPLAGGTAKATVADDDSPRPLGPEDPHAEADFLRFRQGSKSIAHFPKGLKHLVIGSGGTCAGYLYDLDDPLESFATGQLLVSRDAMDSMFHQALMLERTAGAYGIDGVIFHPIKSCRTVSTGMADQRRHVIEKLGLQTLILESDFMDPQVISEAQMRNRVDAFFEGLNSRRLQS
jgi:hypothetical protein